MERKHLKSYQYYADLYDRHTVASCRRLEQSSDETTPDSLETKKVTKKQLLAVNKYAKELMLHWETGERYLRKESTIREWMDADEKKDDLYESAQAPEDIRCLTCRNRMTPTFKELWYGTSKDDKDRVLFMYDCPNRCMPRRAFFSDGEELRTKENLCPKCGKGVLRYKSEDDGKKMITTYDCAVCGYTETDEYEWSHKEDEIDENFPKDRDRFCLTKEAGEKFQQEKWNIEQMGKFMDEVKEKDKIRDEKLKQNPKGFHLDGRGYTCFICGDGTPEGDNWYDKWGIKCLVCQKAIDEGEIPASLAKNKDSWYTKYDLEHYFNVKSPALRKWIKNGVIKSRIVTRYGEGVHTELFLIKDNKDFLPPKKLLESQWGKEIKDGKETRSLHPWYHFGDPREILKGYKIMDHLRVVPPEEVAAQKEAEKKKWEEKQSRRQAKKKK